MPIVSTAMELSVVEERYDRYDAAHATPDPMTRRVLTMRLRHRSARFEQTDYGHPGRFNPWEPRGIDSTLQPLSRDLLALCESVGALLAEPAKR